MEPSVSSEKENFKYCLTCAEVYVAGPESLIHSYHNQAPYTKYREELAATYKSAASTLDSVAAKVSAALKSVEGLLKGYLKSSPANPPKEKPLRAMIAAFSPAAEFLEFLKHSFQRSLEGTGVSSLTLDEILMQIADRMKENDRDPQPSTFLKTAGKDGLFQIHDPSSDEATRILSEIRLTMIRKQEELHKFSSEINEQVMAPLRKVKDTAYNITRVLCSLSLSRATIPKALPAVLEKFKASCGPENSLPTGLLLQRLKDLIRRFETFSLGHRCQMIALAGNMAKLKWKMEPVVSAVLGYVYFAGAGLAGKLAMPRGHRILDAVSVVTATSGSKQRTAQIYCLNYQEYRQRSKTHCDKVTTTYYFSRIRFDPLLCQVFDEIALPEGAENIYSLATIASRVIYGVGHVCAKYSIAKNSWSPIPPLPGLPQDKRLLRALSARYVNRLGAEVELYLCALAERWIYSAGVEGKVFRLDTFDEEAAWTTMSILKMESADRPIWPHVVPLAPTQLLFFFKNDLHVLDTIGMEERKVTFAHHKLEEVKAELVQPPDEVLVEHTELYRGHIYGYVPYAGILRSLDLRSRTFSSHAGMKLAVQSLDYYDCCD